MHAAVCQAVTAWLQVVVGGLLPLLLSSWTWQPPLPPEGSSRSAGSGTGATSNTAGILQRAGCLARRAVATSDSCLRMLLGGAVGSPAVRAVQAWYLLGSCWLACKISAGL